MPLLFKPKMYHFVDCTYIEGLNPWILGLAFPNPEMPGFKNEPGLQSLVIKLHFYCDRCRFTLLF